MYEAFFEVNLGLLDLNASAEQCARLVHLSEDVVLALQKMEVDLFHYVEVHELGQGSVELRFYLLSLLYLHAHQLGFFGYFEASSLRFVFGF